ncbi:MAG: alanine racemase [Zetaproteobacteria bacterium]|nr:MAG: alanine racemase [Zetaproteobacteria bacterium]
MSRPVTARMEGAALQHNYRLLAGLTPEARLMAVVKADGYGHGLEGVAGALWDAGCRDFAVTDAEEGARLRSLLHAREEEWGERASVTLFSGLFDDEDARLVVAHELAPVIHSQEEVARLRRARFSGGLWLKVETGMNRLGADHVRQLLDRCYRCRWPVRGLLSHLACADLPEHPLNARQIERMRSHLNLLGPGLSGSLLNSAGMVHFPEAAFDVVRPGIALYGSQPVAGGSLDLRPVMRLEAEIMQIHRVEAGGAVSYGAEYVATRPMRVAVVAAGYGDGVPRRLGCVGGEVWCGGERFPIVGRVCMDYTMIDVTGSTLRVGDRVQFWGDGIPVDAVAARCGTIGYELFTGVNRRVRRLWS